MGVPGHPVTPHGRTHTAAAGAGKSPQAPLPSALCPHTPETLLLPSASRSSQLSDASLAAPLFLTWSKDSFEVVDVVAGEQQGASEIGCVQGSAHTLFMSLELAPTRDADVVVRDLGAPVEVCAVE
jgi:hypothetical protein